MRTRKIGKSALLEAINRSFFEPDPDSIFIIAANDRQLLNTWRRAVNVPLSNEGYALLEARLVEAKPASQGEVPDWKHSESKRERFVAVYCEIRRRDDAEEGAASHGKREG